MLFPNQHPRSLYGREQNLDLLPRTSQLSAVFILNYTVLVGGGHPNSWALGPPRVLVAALHRAPRDLQTQAPGRSRPVSASGARQGRAWQPGNPAQTVTSDLAISLGGSCWRVRRGHRRPHSCESLALCRGSGAGPGLPLPLSSSSCRGRWVGPGPAPRVSWKEASGLGWDRPGSLEPSQRRKPDGLVGSQARPCLSHLRAVALVSEKEEPPSCPQGAREGGGTPCPPPATPPAHLFLQLWGAGRRPHKLQAPGQEWACLQRRGPQA